MDKSAEITELVSGYSAWVDSDTVRVDSQSQAPAATTTFCAFTVSYMFSRATVSDVC